MILMEDVGVQLKWMMMESFWKLDIVTVNVAVKGEPVFFCLAYFTEWDALKKIEETKKTDK